MKSSLCKLDDSECAFGGDFKLCKQRCLDQRAEPDFVLAQI
jgi:hypothetical protein